MKYNLTLVLRSTLKDADKKKLIEAVRQLFGKAKIGEKEWGQRPLSYPIKREVSGIFVNMSIEGDKPEAGFEKKLLGNDQILRHLFLKV